MRDSRRKGYLSVTIEVETQCAEKLRHTLSMAAHTAREQARIATTSSERHDWEHVTYHLQSEVDGIAEYRALHP